MEGDEVMGKDLKGKEIGEGITQLKNKKYVARFTNLVGKRVEKRFNTIPEAKKWLAESKYESEHGCIASSIDMTVDAWFDYWLSTLDSSIRWNTKRIYRDRYNYRIKEHIGKILLSKIKPLHCQQVLDASFKKGDAQESMQKIRAIMRSMFDLAVENELIPRNPITKSVKAGKREKKPRVVLTKEQQTEFLRLAKGFEYYDDYLFVLNTGIRCGELMALKWSDVDWEKRTITINGTMYYRKDIKEFVENAPKTKSSHRTIPLTMIAYNILEKKKKERNENPISNMQFHKHIFLNSLGKPTINTTYNVPLAKIARWMGIERFSIHSLRHTFATRCIEVGMKPKVLQAILGHSRIETTMDLYVHVTDETLHEEMEIFEQNCGILDEVI